MKIVTGEMPEQPIRMGAFGLPGPGAIDLWEGKVHLEGFPAYTLARNVAKSASTVVEIRQCVSQAALCIARHDMRNDLRNVGPADMPESGTTPNAVDDGALSPIMLTALGDEMQRTSGRGMCASSLQALYACAGGAGGNLTNHPVTMPDISREAGRICQAVVDGAMLDSPGRNASSPADVDRATVTQLIEQTARHWMGAASLIGKREWMLACQLNQSRDTFLEDLGVRLTDVAGERVSPPALTWMLRTALADGLPMHQATVRRDLPEGAGLGTVEWARCALGIAELGEAHWDLSHEQVVSAAKLPTTNTREFIALATSMTSLRPDTAALRLRSRFTLWGVSTARRNATPAPETED